MADSKQLDVLKRITVHLQGVNPDNGYEFDLSESIFRGRRNYGDESELPLVSIVEHPTADVSVDTAGFNRLDRVETWVFLLHGMIVAETDNPTDAAYQMKAAVEKRMAECLLINEATGDPVFPDIYMLGLEGLITGITIGPGVVAMSAQSQSTATAFFYLPLGIIWAVDVSNPFVEE